MVGEQITNHFERVIGVIQLATKDHRADKKGGSKRKRIKLIRQSTPRPANDTGEVMNIHRTTEEWGLLAYGSSRRWDIAVDESLDGDAWTLEIDGPQVYLALQLPDLKVIPAALHFLQSGPRSNQTRELGNDRHQDAALTLGWFASAPVALVWDNEDFLRCFIVIGPQSQSTLRLSLDAEDIQMLTDALRQVAEDLPHNSGE
jgi:hypothetical protein